MAERILIEDVIGNVRYDEGYYGTLQKTFQEYADALSDYASDYSEVKVQLVGLDYYTTDGINNLDITDNYVSFRFTFYDEGVGMGDYQVSISSSSGTIYINDGNLETGWTLKLYVEEPEEESFLDKIGFTRVWNNIKSYIDNREPAIEVQGNWHYRIYNDNSFEAWYGASGVTFVINSQSGNLYRSDLQTLTLPTNLTNQGSTEIISFDVGVGHNNYPVFSTIANMSNTEIKYYVMSGSTRNSSPNYKVSAYVYGLITRN